MPFAARLTDLTAPPHPGLIAGPGVPSVTIEGLPAACKDDVFACAFPPPAGPHPGTTLIKGSATVFIGGRPAARVGDASSCGALIVRGATSVIIGD